MCSDSTALFLTAGTKTNGVAQPGVIQKLGYLSILAMSCGMNTANFQVGTGVLLEIPHISSLVKMAVSEVN